MCDDVCRSSCEALRRKRTRYNTVGKLGEQEERALYIMWKRGQFVGIPFTNNSPTWKKWLQEAERGTPLAEVASDATSTETTE